MKKIFSLLFGFFAAIIAAGQSTDAQLTTQANVIRDETVPGANSKARIAAMFQALIDGKVNRADLLTATGTDTYVISANSTITSYSTNPQFFVKFQNANTGAATLNVNGLGAKAIKKNVSSSLSSGDISAGQIYLLIYDGTNFQLIGGIGGGGGGTWGSITGTLSAQTDLQSALDTKLTAASNLSEVANASIALANLNGAPLGYTTNAQTSNYQLVVGDFTVPTSLEMNSASGLTVTVPTNATAAIASNRPIIIRQLGAGVVTITPSGGVTINTQSASFVTNGQYSYVILTKVGTDSWVLDNPVPSNIANSQLATVGTYTIKGRISSGTGVHEDLTQAQARSIIFNTPKYYRLYSDFSGGTTNEWNTSASGTGASVSFTSDGGDAGHPGVATISTGTTTTGQALIRNGNSSVFTPTDGVYTLDTSFKLSALSDGTDTYTVFVGITNGGAGNGNGWYFRYTHGTNSGKWECVTRHGGVETATDSGVAATTAYQRLSYITNTNSTSVTFYINGTAVATNTTNMPTTSDGITTYVGLIKSAGTTARTMGVDYLSVLLEFNTSR